MTRCAFAKGKIPLPENYDQTGYIARLGASAGTLDEPEIKILLLQEDLSRPSLFVFLDLLGLSPAHSRALAASLARRARTDAEHVSITCTHTHSAPAAMSLLLLGECRESFVCDLEAAIFAAVDQVMRTPALPAEISFAKTAVQGVARNRVRQNETDVDEDLTLLIFKTGEKRIALVNYACHPVTKNADNRLYSRDYPGVVVDTLKREGLFEEVIFATAPCGDLNPILQDEPEEHARMHEYGEKIAEGVRRIVKSDALIATEGFSVKKIPLTLELLQDHPRADLALSLSRAAVGRRDAKDKVKQKYEEANHLWALSHTRLSQLALSETEFQAEITVAAFGALTVIGVPFELFSDIGMRLKARFFPAAVFELCGGDYGYFPSDELWEAAAYERGDAYMYYNRGGPLAKGSEARLFAALEEA